MPKTISFQWNESDFSSEIRKIDRAKLYGYKETEVVDEDGDACEIATLAADGQTLIGKGGTGIGYVTVDGEWCDRNSLQPVGVEGTPLQPVPSSFSGPVLLEQSITVDEFLDYDIRSVYHLPEFDTDGALADSALAEILRKGAIFQFSFSYRGGIEPEPAFLLANSDGDIFLLIARGTQIEYLSLQQTASLADDDDDGDDDDVDAMDFDMI